ncbi:MAG: Gfo/Idh/MocA family oxidoreductase [Saprospiraceae bacterium]|nr:Gfo/Idh/MocA family oxidoreductase [Saprospiraceae bacterium]
MGNLLKRRKFLENTSKAALAGFMPVGSVFSHLSNASDQVNLGVIGTGSRGNWLIKLLQDIPNASVIAGCDIIPERLKKGLELSAPRSKGYSDYRKLLENKDIDAVIVSVPLSLHYEVAVAALEAGKHVYCEKTMCFTTDQALKLGDIVNKSGLKFQVGYQHRYNPLYNNIKGIIQNEDFGELSHIECYWNRNGDWRRPVDNPKWERIINWRMYREFSGGLMAELSSHQLDIVNWILEDLPTSVTGYGGIDYWKDGRETYDHVHSVFKYGNGVQASYTCLTTNAHMGYQMLFYGKNATVQVTGEQGHKAFLYVEPSWLSGMQKPDEVDGVSGATLKTMDPGKPIPIAAGDRPEDDAEPTGKALAGFADCIREDKSPLSNYENGKNSAICVAKANEAMQKEERMDLKMAYSMK